MEITNQLVKILLGLFVFVAVALGIYLFFKYNIIDFFKNLGGSEPAEAFLDFLK
jgi:hypothetical protein